MKFFLFSIPFGVLELSGQQALPHLYKYSCVWASGVDKAWRSQVTGPGAQRLGWETQVLDTDLSDSRASVFSSWTLPGGLLEGRSFEICFAGGRRHCLILERRLTWEALGRRRSIWEEAVWGETEQDTQNTEGNQCQVRVIEDRKIGTEAGDSVCDTFRQK